MVRNISGEKIRLKRIELGLSQEYLAGLLQLYGLNITQKMISRIESGKRGVYDYEILPLSKALNISFEDILTYDYLS